MEVASTLQSPQTSQVIAREVWASLDSNDSAIMREVLTTHAPDGRKVDVKPILTIIDSILLCSQSSSVEVPSGRGEAKASEEMSPRDGTLKSVAPVLEKLCRELHFYTKVVVTTENGNSKRPLIPPGFKVTCMCPTGVDAKATTTVLLKILSNYTWDAKVVLTVAAFASNYGKFFILAQPGAKNASIAQKMDLLCQLHKTIERDELSQLKTEAIIKLVKVIMGVTKSIVDFNDLPTKYLDEPPLPNALAYIPKAAYWTIHSVVICASHVSSSQSGFQESNRESIDSLSRLADEGTKIHQLLTSQLAICKAHIEEKSNKAYLDLVKISSTPQPDNMMILKTLFCLEDCRQYLVDRNNKQIDIEELKGQHVLVLTSGLNISKYEIRYLEALYNESQRRAERQYRVVWLPVLDMSTSWGHQEKQTFDELKSMMPWYMVPDPSKIKPEVIQYIKKKWSFENKTILVPIDPQGVEKSFNALDMLWIWGNEAFPFTKEREESLWGEQSWTLKLLLGSIDKSTLDWMHDGKTVCVCYYGGEDIEWIREFTRSMKAANNIQIVYVGKSNAMKQVQKIIEKIKEEKLSNYFNKPEAIWFFWTRLESILYLEMQRGKNFKNDPIMREVTTLLSYDASGKGWALFIKDISDLTLARGDVALRAMKDCEEGKNTGDGFLPTLKSNLQKYAPTLQCIRIILTGSRREIPSKELSSEGCECALEKCFMYHCCAD